MPITLSQVAGLLKNVYEGPINSAIAEEIMLFNQLKFTNKFIKNFSGAKSIIHAIELVRNTSVGFRGGSAESLPEPAPGEVKQATTTVKSLYAYLEFYGDVLRFTDVDKGAFTSDFSLEVASAARSIRLEAARALYGNGTGELGEVGSIINNNGITGTIVVSIDAGNVTPSPNKHWFERGMFIDIYSPDGWYAGTATKSGNTNGYKILSVSKSNTNATLTVEDANMPGQFTIGSIAEGDKICVKGNYMKEPYGLDAIVDNGSVVSNFLGISESVYDRWNAVVNSNNGTPRELTLDMLQDAIDEVESYGKDMIIITSKPIRKKIYNLIRSTQVTPQSLDLKGGFKALEFSGYPIYGDRVAPYDKLFVVNLKTIIPHQLNSSKDDIFSAFKFDDLDNQILHGTRGYDIYWAKGVMNNNFTCNNRAPNVKITDINPEL